MDKNKVSILLPVHNGALYVRKSITSVLSQTYRDFELLVLDDASTDGTAEVVSAINDPRISYIRNEQNLGLTGTLTKGLAVAKYPLIARIDADDEWIDPKKLELQVSLLETDSTCALVGTQARYVRKDGSVVLTTSYPTDDASLRRLILFKNPFVHSSVLFRAEIAKQHGGYREADVAVEDHSLWLRIAAHHGMAIIDSVAVLYLVNESGISSSKAEVQIKNSFELIKKYKRIFPGYTKAWLKWNIQILLAKLNVLRIARALLGK